MGGDELVLGRAVLHAGVEVGEAGHEAGDAGGDARDAEGARRIRGAQVDGLGFADRRDVADSSGDEVTVAGGRRRALTDVGEGLGPLALDGTARLLHDMGELVGEEVLTCGRVRLEAAGGEDDVVPGRVRRRADLGGGRVLGDADGREVGPEGLLHRPTNGLGQRRSTARSQPGFEIGVDLAALGADHGRPGHARPLQRLLVLLGAMGVGGARALEEFVILDAMGLGARGVGGGGGGEPGDDGVGHAVGLGLQRVVDGTDDELGLEPGGEGRRQHSLGRARRDLVLGLGVGRLRRGRRGAAAGTGARGAAACRAGGGGGVVRHLFGLLGWAVAGVGRVDVGQWVTAAARANASSGSMPSITASTSACCSAN